MSVVPVILSGGSGSRLWPLSRELQPKQLLALRGDATMIQATATRIAGLPEMRDPIVVCNVAHCPEIVAQLGAVGITPDVVVEETVGRNTGPAIVAAALEASAGGADPVLFVAPADHVIVDEVAMKESVAAAVEQAERGRLVTLGIAPSSPHTGYGYIRIGGLLADEVHRVAEFVEKPDRSRAEAYLASRDYLWNSGMLIGRASVILNEARTHAEQLWATASLAWRHGRRGSGTLTLDPVHLGSVPSVSYEHAVLERSQSTAVVTLRSDWSDVGSWSALWELDSADPTGNVFVGDVVADDVRNSYVYSESRLVAAVGVEDCVIVETGDAVLVAHRDATEDIKATVERLREQGRNQVVTPGRVRRPWGTCEVIEATSGVKVKRLVVDPGSRISLQRHRHRAEHWVVARGCAQVTIGERRLIVDEDESVYIPRGTAHRLENVGRIPLEVVEVQIGSYLGEDDIMRLDDDYGRVRSDAPRPAAGLSATPRMMAMTSSGSAGFAR